MTPYNINSGLFFTKKYEFKALIKRTLKIIKEIPPLTPKKLSINSTNKTV